MCSGRPARSMTSNCGAGWPTSTAVLGAERAERRHALVQHADLAGQRQHRERQRHDHDPQHDLGDDQRLPSAQPAPSDRARGEAEQPPDRLVQQQKAPGGGADRDPVERRERAGRSPRASSIRPKPASTRLRATSAQLIRCFCRPMKHPQSMSLRPRARLIAIAAANRSRAAAISVAAASARVAGSSSPSAAAKLHDRQQHRRTAVTRRVRQQPVLLDDAREGVGRPQLAERRRAEDRRPAAGAPAMRRPDRRIDAAHSPKV